MIREAMAVAGLLLIAGCAGKSGGSADGGAKPIKVSAEAEQRYRDPLAASVLRERSMDLLTELTSSPDPQLRANALEAMVVTPARLATFLPRALRDENPGVRSTAAMMVGKAGLRDMAPALRPLLNDPSPYVKASAIYALTKNGIEIDQSPLATMLLNDASARVRSHAAFLLGEIGDSSALGLLHEAAKSAPARAAGAEVRMLQLQIAEAMVKLGEEGQIGSIRAALYPARPEDLEVSALAVQIIGQLRDKGSTDELIYITAKSTSSGRRWPAEVRLAAAGGLARMGLTQGTFLADEYAAFPMPALRAQSAYVYGEIGHAANFPKLETLLGDAEGIVRVSAAAAVLKMTANPALPPV